MKHLLAVISICVVLPTSVLAADFVYTLEDKGTYCSYNVSKQLKELDGVMAESVDVGLKNKIVKLQGCSL